MDTVSYLTINDETKEIADIASRNNIEDMAAIIAAHTNDIQYIQLETGPEGSFSTSLSEMEAMALSAEVNAAVASEAAMAADEKAVEANEAATNAWEYADSANSAAQTAWNRADQALTSATAAEAAATSAINSANTARSQANSAAEAAATAWNKANEAGDAANLADHKADLASVAAEAAQYDANLANSYANNALAGLSTLESVIDTINWFSEHKTLSTDIEVNSNKNYYIHNPSTGTMSKVEPNGSENPNEEGWYEIDETVQNYIASRIAQTPDGLYVASTSTKWKILISDGSGEYPPGIYLIDEFNTIKQASTENGISFDKNGVFYLGDPNDERSPYLVFDGIHKTLTLGGTGVNINSGVTIGESNKTLAQVLTDLGQAITVIEYGVGNSPDSHEDVEEWSSESPQWEPGKYVWMRISNGTNYRYTCIQGAQGPAGVTGATGASGEPGTEGVGVQSVEISYATSETNYTMPEDDAWLDEIDTENPPEQGTWLWIRTVTTYTDDTSSATYQQSYIGTDGEAGQNAIRIEIDSIGGNFIKRGQTGTSLIAHVYEGTNDITNQFSHFTWYRRRPDGTRDTSWSTQETSNQLSITTADVDESAVFVCEVTVTR